MKELRKKILHIAMLMAIICGIVIPVARNTEVAQAKAPYYIQVNKNTNVVTVYQNKVNGVYKNPIKAFVCSVGYATPTGTFSTPAKYRWHTLDGPSYGQYCTRIVGSILFHSVWYYEYGENDSISVAQYNKLGTTASHGCVRLTVADAKWIYDNCPLGTEVTIIEGSSKDDPLGKPEALKLNTNNKTDWCPTDPDPRNPYANKKPKITGAKNKTVQLNSTFNALDGVTATDTAGNDATSKLKVSGKVNTSKSGTYQIIYKITDAIGRTATKKVKITVKDTSTVVISAKNKTVQLGTSFDPLKGVTAKTKAGTNRTSTLKYSGKVNTNKLGTYKVTYTAKDVLGRSVKKTVTITVTDKTTVVISAKNQKVQLGTSFDPLKGVTAKTKAGTDRTSTLKYSGKVNTNKVGTYKVTYSAKKVDGTKVTKTITVTVGDYKKPVLKGVENKVIYTTDVAEGESIDLLDGVTATATNGKDLTSRIKVTGSVDPHTIGTYKVTYSVTNDSNLTTEKTVTYIVKDPEYVSLEGIKNLELIYKSSAMTDEEKEAQVKEAVLAQVTGYILGKEQPDTALVIAIKEQDLDYYFVTVTIDDNDGHTLEGQCYVTLSPK